MFYLPNHMYERETRKIISYILFSETRTSSDVLSSSETNSFTSLRFDSFQREWKKLWHANLRDAPSWASRFPPLFRPRLFGGEHLFCKRRRARLYLRRCPLAEKCTKLSYAVGVVVKICFALQHSARINTKTPTYFNLQVAVESNVFVNGVLIPVGWISRVENIQR